MRTTARLLTTAALTAATTLGLAGAAGAAPTPTAATAAVPAGSVCVETSQAIGCFVPSGDHVLVHDRKTDGWTPRVQWKTGYGRSGTCVWTGTATWTDCNYNMREREYIHFRLVLSDGHRTRSTPWQSTQI